MSATQYPITSSTTRDKKSQTLQQSLLQYSQQGSNDESFNKTWWFTTTNDSFSSSISATRDSTTSSTTRDKKWQTLQQSLQQETIHSLYQSLQQQMIQLYRVVKTHRMPSRHKSFPAKEPLIIGLFCGKWPMKIRHPMTLRHPVQQSLQGERDKRWQTLQQSLQQETIYATRHDDSQQQMIHSLWQFPLRSLRPQSLEMIWLKNNFHDSFHWKCYGVATTSRLLKIIGFFCKRAL